MTGNEWDWSVRVDRDKKPSPRHVCHISRVNMTGGLYVWLGY